MARRIVAYHLGTGGAEASFYAEDGACLQSVFIPYDTHYPAGGWHEQRPDAWWRAIVQAIRQLLAGGGPAAVEGLAGGSSQEPSPLVRGGFFGIDLRHTRADLVREVMEGVALDLGAVLVILRGCARLDEEMLLVGGGSRSALWRQIFADVYGMRVLKTNLDQDAGSLGAAAVAAVGTGLWTGFSRVDAVHASEAAHEPRPAAVPAYARLMRAFRSDAHRRGRMPAAGRFRGVSGAGSSGPGGERP
jgi:sugar (pentulose or hexulose) kinase